MAVHWHVGMMMLGLCLGCGLAFEDVDLGGYESGRRVWEAFESAGDQLSAVSSRGMKSIGRELPQVPFRSKDSTYRRVLQDSKSYCAWSDGACALTTEAAVELLKGSSSQTSEYILALFRCEDHSTSEKCKSDSSCIWAEDSCTVNSDSVESGSISKCLGKASIFLEYSDLKYECSSEYEDSFSCNNHEGCIWDENKDSCQFDLWKGLFGIQSANGGPKGLGQVQRAQGFAWTKAVASDPNFLLTPNPATILQWKPPKIQCPEGIEEVLCAYAAPLSEIFVTTLYCQRQHEEDDSGCDEDPLCAIRNSRCTVSKEVRASVIEKQLQVLVSSSGEDPIVGDLLLPFMSCPAKAKKFCWGVCSWDESENTCGVHVLWLLQRLASTASKDPAPECKVLTSVYAAGCIGAGTKGCYTNPKCEWDVAKGDCSLVGSNLQSIILSAAPDVRTVMSEHEACSKHASETTCLT